MQSGRKYNVDQRPLIAPEPSDRISATKAAIVMTEASQPLTGDLDNIKDMSDREWNLFSVDLEQEIRNHRYNFTQIVKV